MVLGKKVAILDWEWGGSSAPREGQQMPCSHSDVKTKADGLGFYTKQTTRQLLLC